MNIEELTKLIEEIEITNQEYQKIIKKRKEKRQRKKLLNKQKKLYFTLGCFLSILGIIKIRELKQMIDNKVNNIYQENTLKISQEEIKQIQSKIEKNLNIILNDEDFDEYFLLNAIIENKYLTEDEKQLISTEIINIIEDDPYINKENAYHSLLNVNITNMEKPFYIKNNVVGRYVYKDILDCYKNEIYIYDNTYVDVLEHELIHCLLISDENRYCPRFLKEGLTEQLTNEYFSQDYDMELFCYPYEVLAIKILNELVTANTVLETYTTGNMNLIYNKLLELDPSIDAKAFMKDIDQILEKNANNIKISEQELDDLENKCKQYFLFRNNEVNKVIFKYYLELFNTLKESNPYSSYLEMIKEGNYIPVIYYNTNSIATVEEKNNRILKLNKK